MNIATNSSTNTSEAVLETSASEIQNIFKQQSANQYHVARANIRERRAKLDLLRQVILKYREEIKEALYKDFRKHPTEVDIIEIFPVISAIKLAKRSLGRWMDRERVGTPIALLGSSSYIHYEPKGVVLIISPWNFPFNLTFGPLVSAIAAGNTVMIKPSEITPHSSALMKKMISEVFNENEIALIEGGVATSTELLALPFNHIFFTGAPSIGKIVMTAAAKNLCSVTLELGGKSPTIIDKTANIKSAAKRITMGKFSNNGQICIAPDYVYAHNDIKDAFLEELSKQIKSFYGESAKDESSYGRIVSEKHYHRIKSYIDDAMSKGAKKVLGLEFDQDEKYISPTVLEDVSLDSELMKNEIFGPVLPVFGFDDVEEVTKEISTKEKPLALYIYSNNRKNINQIMENTRAGGTCINQTGVHFYNHNLPFGGSNNSGIGKAHGHEGFKEFSNARGVLKQNIPNALELLMPPYNNFKQKLIDLTIKWL